MPSPWAAAVALLALLAFGVFVGATLTPAQPSGASARVLLAGSPHSTTATNAASAAKPPPVPAESTEPGAETSAEATATTPETTAATTTTTTTTASTPSPAGGKTKSSPTAAGETTPPGAGGLPPVGHVFVIVLSGIAESEAFGAGSQAAYLSKTLRAQGELIENYHALDGSELANAIALISGQGPTPQTAEDCPLYTDLSPATAGKQGQTLGNGCVYPATTLTVADQLTSAGKTWRAYVEDIGNGGPGEAHTCRHPALGAADSAHTPVPGDAYVTWRNPFVYFHSLTDVKACASNDVGLDRLASDLQSAGNTPSLAYIVPNRCHDGSPQPCAPGQPAGPTAADAFLRKIVPEIESSAAYKQSGLIAITSDQAPPEGGSDQAPGGGASGQVPAAGETSAGPAAGGKVGLLLISKYVKPASFNVTGEYSHLSLLRSIEDLFGLQPLGYAGEPGLLAFDTSVFNGSTKR
jgi:phosphatidylinositol-3-phosphatase